ncbi:DUF4238 domain-containing protein [Novosphingobium sp. JCM 18896]|uniref:DUF4238 domain-containing protein n=1 Tax=Novosphingobium sp. JCM 18896 TaxID=2989731 RepID=UPI00222268A3|nr:DUF4238 domain-containing protein [Novosphingobium sp. JCM 18896]MCW1432156.1 DUF4238 domain-containing protein [Novosphingobium sp. JCM 18896]
MAANEPKKHHYVPQFYMRRFACADDENKVMVLERHREVVVADRKSIENIGYEDHLHDYDDNGAPASIEKALNRVIETPFSESPTWRKISSGNCAALDGSDRLPLYGFARHLQLRNHEMLRFIEAQHARFLAGELEEELTDEEREMHEWIAADPAGAHELFRTGAMQTMLPPDSAEISVTICQAPIAFRSSTNPAVRLSHPGRNSVFGATFNSLRTWWLTLDRHWGAFIMAGGPPGFGIETVPPDFARVVNRQYLVQFLEGNARYMLADDAFLGEDLEWAGFCFAQRTTRGFRYRKS